MLESLAVTRLRHLGPDFWLAASCERCFHWADLDRARLERRLGPDVRLDDLTRRLRCGSCGAREVLLYRGYYCGGHRSSPADGPGSAAPGA